MNEPWVVHGVDVLFLLNNGPHNFVQRHHSLQGQPIQELHHTLPN